ncbi:MAG: hypothetical protein JOY62_04570 [Acidobacteriaceae bacterium]|nr:hypothetical protein [Acidobacteriaceae bacterium]MBV9779229.1 hypothetical protein [Acidobacteriaceae bacterium]
MKPTTLIRITASALSLSTVLIAQDQSATAQGFPRYKITDLGTLGGISGLGLDITNTGLISGSATLPDGTSHAVLERRGTIDIGAPGLGGPNSTAQTVNEKGRAVGAAETTTKDPKHENFCGFGTDMECLAFSWQDGLMTPLRTLGGNNGQAISINKLGEIAGVAENSTADKSCAQARPSQIFRYDAVLWGPKQGEIRELRLLPGDTVGIGLWINDKGQAIGNSGTCGNTIPPPIAVGPHAVLWEPDGSVHDLGNLGGKCLHFCINPVVGPSGNIPLDINNEGQVVGASALSDETTIHAFFWQSGKMHDLGTLDGDIASVALGINDAGDVVGSSMDASGNSRAFLRKNAKMTALADLIASDSPLFPVVAEIINSREEIVGIAVQKSTGDVHGFLAIPCSGDDRECCNQYLPAAKGETSGRADFVLSETTRQHLKELLWRGHHVAGSR